MGPGPGPRGRPRGGGGGGWDRGVGEGSRPGAHVRLDPRRLLSGTSTPVAMHFHKKGMEISYIINKIFRIRQIICDILLFWCPKCVQNVFWGPKMKILNFRKKIGKFSNFWGPQNRGSPRAPNSYRQMPGSTYYTE